MSLNNKKNNKIKTIVLAAMFASMITVTTAFISLPMGFGGYVHIGDAFIYLAACFLPTPIAMLTAGIGGGLADLILGYPHYIIFTVIIKAVNAVFFTNKNEKLLSNRNMIMALPSGLVTVLGYSIAKFILDLLVGAGNAAALADSIAVIPENSMQAFFSGLLFIAVAAALDSANVKNRLTLK